MNDKKFVALVLALFILSVVLTGYLAFEVGKDREGIEILEGLQTHITLFTSDGEIRNKDEVEAVIEKWIGDLDAEIDGPRLILVKGDESINLVTHVNLP